MKNVSDRIIPIVLCAGLGTRLRPLTYCVPKVVAPLGNVPIAFTSIRRFLDAGFDQVQCNTHYLADYVEEELRAAMTAFGYDQNRLRCWREPELLNSGGGIQRIWENLAQENSTNKKKDVFVVSGDLYAQLPLEDMLSEWDRRSENETSLFGTKQLLEDRSDVTWVDMSTRIIKGFGRDHPKDAGFTARNFTGQQIISSHCLLKATVEVRSSIDMYYRAALSRGEVIKHFIYDDSFDWFNIGTYQEFSEAMSSPSVSGLRLFNPKDCLLIKTSRETYQRSECLINYRVNTLRTCPRVGGESLATMINSLIKNGIEPCLGGEVLNSKALVFALASGLGNLQLGKPMLVPLELLNSEWLPSTWGHSPYLTSQTYLLV